MSFYNLFFLKNRKIIEYNLEKTKEKLVLLNKNIKKNCEN